MSSEFVPIQGTLFAEDYLRRSLGPISNDPFVALTELVANAWDAGASEVRIEIPHVLGGVLTVQDDGTGMTREQFLKRWMTLGYSRVKHQGEFADFPPGRSGRRHAFGKSGIGRHGLLCFADEYLVETRHAVTSWRFAIRALSGKEPFGLVKEERLSPNGHGTTLKVAIERNLPDPDQVRGVLAVRFLHDPTFSVLVNDISVPLTELSGFIEQSEIHVDGLTLSATCVDSSRWAHRVAYHGVAFWVGGRLVGEPSWQVGEDVVLDGRTKPARRYSIIVQSDDLFEYVLPDWSGFHTSQLVCRVQRAVVNFANGFLRGVLADRAHETKATLLREHREQIEQMDTLGRVEVAEFLDQVTYRAPTINVDTLEVATAAVVNLVQSHSGRSLLAKLSNLAPDDIDALNQILDEWSARDVLIVMREIDRRLAVIEALDRVVNGPLRNTADELHTIHPLVTQARWLFGPQYESEEYAFNKTVKKALEELFKTRIANEQFFNPRHRPDLLCLGDSTLSAVATEKFRDEGDIVVLDRILIIEVKRANKTLSRPEIQQAEGYVEDLAASGLIDGSPRIDAFVVGTRLAKSLDRRIRVRRLGDPPFGRVEVFTFDQLIRTAERRLFRLRDKLSSRFDGLPALDLVNEILSEPKQISLDLRVN